MHRTTDPRDTRVWSLQNAKLPLKTFATAIAATGSVTLIAAIAIRPSLNLNAKSEAYSIIEPTQPYAWLMVASVATIACAAQATRRGTLLALWIATLASAAGLRELDLHTLINPDSIHLIGINPDFGVRFRIDWWLGEAPPLARPVWATMFAAGFAITVLPFAFAHYPWPQKLLKRDPFASLIALGFAALAAAYVIDDLLRPLFVNADLLQDALEEAAETTAPLLLLTAAIILATNRASLTPTPKH